MQSKKMIVLVGPTAVGKTDLALLLAKKLNGEIVSCDSMQVYREISILSNKPSKKIQQSVPHHLINVVSVSRPFDVALFNKKALAAIRKIQKKGKIPVIVGGSGLYMSVLLDGIFQGAPQSQKIRAKLARQAEEKGSAVLHKKLETVDPKAASKIHPNDTKRIIRALEVFELTKAPISQLQEKRRGLWGRFDIQAFVLNRDREKLYQRINRRVDKMFDEGAVAEVKRLSKKKWSKTAASILGIKEITAFLDGRCSLEETKNLLKRNSRRYAKRQLTWFRKDKRLKWINIREGDRLSTVAQKILKEFN